MFGLGRGLLVVARTVWSGLRWACMGAVAFWLLAMLLVTTVSAVLLPLSLIIHWHEIGNRRMAGVVLIFMGLLFGGIAMFGWHELYRSLRERRQEWKQRRTVRQWRKWAEEHPEAAAALLRRRYRTWYDGLQEQDLSN